MLFLATGWIDACLSCGVNMTGLLEAIQEIEQQVCVAQARCVIADEGFPGESSLLGTRDGFLNLALSLLRFVAGVDSGCCQIIGDDYAWDDRIKAALYQLPTRSAWIVGAYLFRNHTEYMASLTKTIDPQIGCPLLNDPQFADPEAGRS